MTTSGDHLRTFVDRVERLNEEIKGLNGDKRDLFAEAKSAGFDVPALKIVIQRRAKDPDTLTELEAIVETYESQLGTPVALARAPARPAPIIKAPAAVKADPAPPTELDDIPAGLDRRTRKPAEASA